MSDEELDRLIRQSRPHTAADDGWTSTPAGEHALLSIRTRLARRSRGGLALLAFRRPRLVGFAVGLAAATAAAIAVGLAAGPSAIRGPDIALPPTPRVPSGPVPAHLSLVSYTSCDTMLAQLRTHAANHVGPYGLPGEYLHSYAYDDLALGGPVAFPADGMKSLSSAPAHSTTNTQEVGVGEPDIVVTDGRRIVSVSGGVLRVVDAATHEITGSLDLGAYAGAQNAQLLMSGDRVLVILDNYATYYYEGLVARYPYPGPLAGPPGTTIALVDLAGRKPSIISTLHTAGRYVQARMVGDTVRLVVQSTPNLTFPTFRARLSVKERTARNRAAVQRAPLSAWLPSYQVVTGADTTTATVPCTAVSHPAEYTGTSMLTVYTVALSGDLTDPMPIALAANAATVYASTSSLYVADERSTAHQQFTQFDRFDITGAGKPTYLGSHTIPGGLLDSYSMSAYDGALRVVTTTEEGAKRAGTAVTVLDENTLAVEGRVGGLGRGERVHAVRFLGPLAYVVTFRSVDPLFVIDLHDPAHPTVAGELTMRGYSDYLHPIDGGRLLGVGEDVTPAGMVNGLQVSLFDIASPTDPRRLDSVTRKHTPSETPIDPHAFLYWAADHLAVIPIDSWDSRQSGAALVLRVDGSHLSVLGTVRNPAEATGGYQTGIERTLVIGDQLWTMSSAGLLASGLHSLDREAWVPFR